MRRNSGNRRKLGVSRPFSQADTDDFVIPSAVFVHAGDRAILAFVPEDRFAFVAGEVAGTELRLSQAFQKEGEARCCPTGRHALTVSLDRID